MSWNGTWKGVDKPAGTSFWAPKSHADAVDCPACKFGTLSITEDGAHCIDCRMRFTLALLQKLGVLRKK